MDGTRRPSRRDFLHLGAAIAGAAALQPGTLGLVPSEHDAVAAIPPPSAVGVDPKDGVDQSTHPAATEPVKRVEAEAAQVALDRAQAIRKRELNPLPQSLPRSTAKRPNVVLIVLDTVRADHLSCYGYRRETTPNIDAFAAEGRRYQNVVSPAAWTLPSHASLFTGLMPSVHGATGTHRSLDDRFDTLAKRLAASGYQTVGLASNPGYVTPRQGLDRGFQTFWNPTSQDLGLARWVAGVMHRELAGWLTHKYDPGKPFFLFLNYIEAHISYQVPLTSLQFASAETWNHWTLDPQKLLRLVYEHMFTADDVLSSKDVAELESLYDDAIQYIDRKVGQVLACLKSTGLDENTAVFITADHGEHFNEHHLMSHSCFVYEPLVHVPLIARHQDRFPVGKEEKLVQSHDVYPTILELAGIEENPTAGCMCQSLLQPLSDARVAISEWLYPPSVQLDLIATEHPSVDVSRFVQRIRAIRRGNMKLIRSSEAQDELYDLAADPLENRNLAERRPDVTRELARSLDIWLGSIDRYVATSSRHRRPTPGDSSEAIKAMRGLGYVP